MVMFILETTVPRLDLEGVSVTFAYVSSLPFTVQNIELSVDALDSHIHALEATVGLEVGGGRSLSRNSRRNQNSRSGANCSGGNGGGVIVYIP